MAGLGKAFFKADKTFESTVSLIIGTLNKSMNSLLFSAYS